MTRKRFMKRLMARGASRNWAARKAAEVEPPNSYKAAYPGVRWMLYYERCGVPWEELASMLRAEVCRHTGLAETEIAIHIERAGIIRAVCRPEAFSENTQFFATIEV